MALKVDVRLNRTTKASIRTRLALVCGTTAVAIIRAPVAIPEIRYQLLIVNVVSTSGAHSTFQVCGNRLQAASPAIAATPIPA